MIDANALEIMAALLEGFPGIFEVWIKDVGPITEENPVECILVCLN